VIWWGLVAMAGVVIMVGVPIWLLRWISSDDGVERESARERFRAEQEARGLRRAGKLTPR
jgi:hypothetical protein